MLDVNIAFAKSRNKVDSLREINVTIVVAMDEQHRRFPFVDGADRRRIVGKFGEFGSNVFAVPIVGGPIMHAMKIDAGGEKVGVAREPHRGEIAAVTAAPQADFRGVHVGAGLQIFSGGNYILIFAGAATGAAGSFAEGAAVANTAAIVDGEDDVAAAGQILVEAIAI